MGISHLPIILLLLGVALIVFGPMRLPELGHGLGRAITEFKKAGKEVTELQIEEPAAPGPGRPDGQAASSVVPTALPVPSSSAETHPPTAALTKE